MNLTHKNIIITLSFIILIGTLFLSISSAVQIIITLIVFALSITLLNSFQSQKNIISLLHEVDELISFERNKVELDENTQNEIELYLNKLLKKYEQQTLTDTKVAERWFCLLTR